MAKEEGFELIAKEEDPFTIQTQLPISYDYSGYSMLDWQNDEFAVQEGYFGAPPLMEVFPANPLSASLSGVQTSISTITTTQDDQLSNYENGHAVFHGLGPLFPNEGVLFLCNKEESTSTGSELNEEKKSKKRREEQKINTSVSKVLTREIISNYFYIPITQAAKELNLGLTLLKKRCRELGIRRWPHRKLMSLQTLIKNVQEMSKTAGGESDRKLREAIDVLEREKKMLEEMPDMQLEHNTKRLRQACFKANYKKRKLMGMVERHSSSSSRSLVCLDATGNAYEGGGSDDDEEIKSLLYDYSCSSIAAVMN